MFASFLLLCVVLHDARLQEALERDLLGFKATTDISANVIITERLDLRRGESDGST